MPLKNKFFGWIKVEMMEHLPWALVAYTVGILLVCLFKMNPYIVVGMIGISAVTSFIFRRHLILSWFSLLTLCLFLGIGNLMLRVSLSHHIVLKEPLYQTRIEAEVHENQFLLNKQILTLKNIRWKTPRKMPQKIKVHFNNIEPPLSPGDKVKALVSIYPPDVNFSPSYAYQLWFDEIGATGVAKEIIVLKKAPRTIFLDNLRTKINQHLFQILSPSQAEIAAPLITGEQKLVSRETYQIYRRSGIAHVLSVSGFHMALLATFLFFVIRSVLALFPKVVLYDNTKKMAAVVALIVTFLYLGLSGFQIPAIRAFIMIALVFLGVLIERPVVSMRSVMVTALVLLGVMPQMLLSISFQLSFMAVIVLVAVCEYLNQKTWPRLIKIIIGFLFLNIAVSGALIPLIAYHFHQWMPYGILGNMLFSGAFSFFIMPLLFIGALMMPFRMDLIFFKMAGGGLNVVRYSAQKLAGLPYAEITINDYSSLSLCFICFGILLICWMRTPLKWLGGILMLFGALWGIWA